MNVRLVSIGKRKQSVSAWCREYGAYYGRVMCRLKRGWTLKDALTKPYVEHKDRNKKKELHRLADAHGLNLKTVYNRIERGWPKELWFSPSGTRRPGIYSGLRNNSAKPVVIDGAKMTRKEAAARLGLSSSVVFRQRILRGWSLRRVFTTRKNESKLGLGNHAAKPVVVDGVKMTRRDAARRIGLKDSSLRSRETAGWRMEDVLTVPKIPITECYARTKANNRRRELAAAGLII